MLFLHKKCLLKYCLVEKLQQISVMFMEISSNDKTDHSYNTTLFFVAWTTLEELVTLQWIPHNIQHSFIEL